MARQRYRWFLWPAILIGPSCDVSAKFVGSMVLPHGDFALDPFLLPENSKERHAAEEVASAARVAGSWLSTIVRPDIILVSTPHGMELTHDFAFYLGTSASGYADIGKDLHNNSSTGGYRVGLEKVSLVPHVASHLVDHLKDQAVSGILNFADSEDMALRWGEVVPMLFLEANSSHFIILSHPLRRYNESASMVPELLRLGNSLRQWADERPERIALLISSDLSHTHRSDGPYGFSNASAPFDAAIARWALDPIKNAQTLLQEATSLQDQAMSCGFTGLVMLHGYLKGGHFNAQVLANRNATYYGMMVATFENTDEDSVQHSMPKSLQM